MSDRCRHAARVGDVLLPCTITGVHSTFTQDVPAVGGRDEHRHAPRTEFRSVTWVDGDVWDVVQPDQPLEDDAREQALTLLRKKGIREWYPAVQTLHKAGLLAQNAPSASAQQRACEVIRESDDVRCKHGDLCGDHVAHDVVDLLTEAGVLSEPCRHEPIESRGWCPADGRVVAERTALPHGDCGSIHRTLFVEQEEGP